MTRYCAALQHVCLGGVYVISIALEQEERLRLRLVFGQACATIWPNYLARTVPDMKIYGL